MLALAFVLIPSAFGSLQETLDASLAPFRRGGFDEFPKEKLAFDDVTPELRDLHRVDGRFFDEGRSGFRCEGEAARGIGLLDTEPLRSWMRARQLSSWQGRLNEIEPDFDIFADRFSRYPRDPETGGFGQWLNPLGRWDWWDLGGRFDGAIAGARRAAGDRHMISSGPNEGRDLVGHIAYALGAQERSGEAEIEANVEPVSALLQAAREDRPHAFPTALVLPLGACADDLRWIDDLGWRKTPGEVFDFLGIPREAQHRAICRAAYERFEAYAAAGITYHL